VGGCDIDSGDGERLGQAFAERAGSAGVVTLQIFGQRLEVPFDIADLVQLATGDHWMVEDRQHRRPERLAPVEDTQDRPGHLEPTLTQPHQELFDQGHVLGVVFDDGEWVLGALNVDAEGHYTAVTCEMDPVEHQGDEIEPGEILGHQLGQSGLGRGHEPPGDR
jgi:hypothetical protein